VALKVIIKEELSAEEIDLVLHESDILADLSHPNIV